MAAHEGSDHAEQAERRDIGDATLEQLRADLIRLSAELTMVEPLSVFRDLRRLRSRIYAALDRQLWPRDQSELYFQLGALHCLMALQTIWGTHRRRRSSSAPVGPMPRSLITGR
jgi:hypothetical protein